MSDYGDVVSIIRKAIRQETLKSNNIIIANHVPGHVAGLPENFTNYASNPTSRFKIGSDSDAIIEAYVNPMFPPHSDAASDSMSYILLLPEGSYQNAYALMPWGEESDSWRMFTPNILVASNIVVSNQDPKEGGLWSPKMTYYAETATPYFKVDWKTANDVTGQEPTIKLIAHDRPMNVEASPFNDTSNSYHLRGFRQFNSMMASIGEFSSLGEAGIQIGFDYKDSEYGAFISSRDIDGPMYISSHRTAANVGDGIILRTYDSGANNTDRVVLTSGSDEASLYLEDAVDVFPSVTNTVRLGSEADPELKFKSIVAVNATFDVLSYGSLSSGGDITMDDESYIETGVNSDDWFGIQALSDPAGPTYTELIRFQHDSGEAGTGRAEIVLMSDLDLDGTAKTFRFDNASDGTLTFENEGAGAAHLIMTEGNLTLTSGNLVLTAGDLTMTGTGTVTGDLSVDNITLDGSIISADSGNLNIQQLADNNNLILETYDSDSTSAGDVVIRKRDHTNIYSTITVGDAVTIDTDTSSDNIDLSLGGTSVVQIQSDALALQAGCNAIEKASTLTIDVQDAAADSTLNITNTEDTYDCNVNITGSGDLSVGGDLTVGGSISGTIDADTLDTIDSVEFLQRDGSVALTAGWAAGDEITGVTNLEVDNITLNGSTLSASAQLTLQHEGTGNVLLQAYDSSGTNPGQVLIRTEDTGGTESQIAIGSNVSIDADGTLYLQQSGTSMMVITSTEISCDQIPLDVDNIRIDGSKISGSTNITLNAESGTLYLQRQGVSGHKIFLLM
jgi:hypothetical protein